MNVDDAAFTTCLSDAAEAYEDAACAAVPPPASCQGVGTLGEGESCASAFECASLLCLAEDDETGCGTCHVAVEDGDPCVEDAQCPSLACVEGVCGEPGGEGAPCDSLPDCTTNACAQGACAEVSVSGEGEPCGDGESYCTPGAELLCDVDQGECVANPRPEPGALDEACVLYTIDLGGFAFEVPLCEEGTTCVEDVCVLASLPFGSCGDGQECIGSVCEAGTCAPEVDPNLCACP